MFRAHGGSCDARSGTGSLENFPHLAHTTSELRVRELDSEAPSSRTRCSGVVCTRWGKFSREPVPDLASQGGRCGCVTVLQFHGSSLTCRAIHTIFHNGKYIYFIKILYYFLCFTYYAFLINGKFEKLTIIKSEHNVAKLYALQQVKEVKPDLLFSYSATLRLDTERMATFSC